jgi:uncharacterized protein YlxP (DUF503 family)
MVVLVQTWDLHLEGCQSLKDKRSVLNSLKADLRRRLNLSLAEVEHQDLSSGLGWPPRSAVTGRAKDLRERTG